MPITFLPRFLRVCELTSTSRIGIDEGRSSPAIVAIDLAYLVQLPWNN
jgi:hypothetical protein